MRLQEENIYNVQKLFIDTMKHIEKKYNKEEYLQEIKMRVRMH